jgi:hypothetical protein
MCVAVILNPGATLKRTEIEKMYMSNADGVGVAWAKDGVVRWYKTTKVSFEYITKLVANWADYPRLVHFRYSTAGGVRPDLCHPFEIGPLATCKPIHETQLAMIHNGHWGRWDEVRDLLKGEGLLPDAGPWSDTRLAALLAYSDIEWLNALGGKVAIMSGDGDIKTLGHWEELREGIWVSNKAWETSSYKRGGYTGFKNWKGWEWDDVDWDAYAAEQEAEKKAEEEEDAKRMAAVNTRTPDSAKAKTGGGGKVNGHSAGNDKKSLGTYEQSSGHLKGSAKGEVNNSDEEVEVKAALEAGWKIVDRLPEGASLTGKPFTTRNGRIYQATSAGVVVEIITRDSGKGTGDKASGDAGASAEDASGYTGDTENGVRHHGLCRCAKCENDIYRGD